MNTTTTPTDIQSLIGQIVSSEHIHIEHERELMEADFTGYDEWSAELEGDFTEGDVENFNVIDGRVYHKPEPQRGPFLCGIKI